ncbi:MAG: hypothetical protein GY716_22780 [bacterium]|nr:hypothetical protein [bacterium]
MTRRCPSSHAVRCALDAQRDRTWTLRRRLASTQSCLIGLFLMLHPSFAAVITVDNASCTLVDAFTAAESDSVAGGCIAGDGVDEIHLTGDVTLTLVDNTDPAPAGNWPAAQNGLPHVATDITLEGGGFTIERAPAAPTFRLLSVASTGSLTLNDVTLRNGRSDYGGAIRLDSGGTLLVQNSVLENNTATVAGGAIASIGHLTLTNSSITSNTATWGTALLLYDGSATLEHCSLFANSGQYYGVYSHGADVTLTDTVVHSNTADNVNGGVWVDGAPNQFLMTNSTISNNAGIQLQLGSVQATLAHSTIFADSTHALRMFSTTATVSNSVIANAIGSSACAGGVLIDNGHNYSTDTNNSCVGFAALTGFDTLLTDNGGNTLTHELLPGSSAIDVSQQPCGVTVDQRGVPRDDGFCDAGAFEHTQSEPRIAVDGIACNLVDAIASADSDTPVGGCTAGEGADFIDVATDTLLVTAHNVGYGFGDNGFPLITTHVVIDGGGFKIERDAGAEAFRFFEVGPSGTLSISNTTLRNGEAASGGAIRSLGTLRLTDTTITESTAALYGGGLYFRNSNATLEGVTISGNETTYGSGGGIHFESTVGGYAVSLTNSTISGNTSVDGGGIFSRGPSPVSLTNSTLSGNEAARGGGNRTAPYGSVTLTDSIVGHTGLGGNCYSIGPGGITNNGDNFDDDGTCPGFGALTGLAPDLEDNGGPTLTHGLTPGSSAVDAAGNCGLPFDQRGAARDDGSCDSGAFERGPR